MGEGKPVKICQESTRPPEEKEKIMRQILGLSEPDDPPPARNNGNGEPVCPAPNSPANKGK
jgi:hypothetical protein